MKNKIITLLFLLISVSGFGQVTVPNTTTFSLQDIYDAVSAHTPVTTANFQSCVDNAIDGYFDPLYYTAPATNFLEFRNYGDVDISYVDGNVVNGTTGTLNVGTGTGTEVGHLLVLLVYAEVGTSITTPSGFTQHSYSNSGTYPTVGIYYKLAAAGDISSGVTVTFGNSTAKKRLELITIAGASPTFLRSIATASGTGTSYTISSGTCTANSFIVIMTAVTSNAAIIVSNSETRFSFGGYVQQTSLSAGSSYWQDTNGGTVASTTVTFSSGNYIGIMFEIYD